MSEIFSGVAPARRRQPGCFGWSQRQIDGGVLVQVTGELDLSTSAELRQRLTKVVESSGGAVIVLDLSELRFLDAHSVGLILAAWTAARCRGGRLEVDGLHGIPERLFGVLGLERLLNSGACEDTAGRDARGRSRRTDVAARARPVRGAREAG